MSRPALRTRLVRTVLLSALALSALPLTSLVSPEKGETIGPKHTSKWDAFAQQNRLGTAPGPIESPRDYAFGIESRIANQAARRLIRRPEGFSEEAFQGFKLFFRVFGEPGQSVGNCVICHVPPSFASAELDSTSPPATSKAPTLRNLSETSPYGSAGQHQTLEDVLREKLNKGNSARAKRLHPPSPAMAQVVLTEHDIAKLAAFLRQLDDVGQERFRYFLIHFDN